MMWITRFSYHNYIESVLTTRKCEQDALWNSGGWEHGFCLDAARHRSRAMLAIFKLIDPSPRISPIAGRISFSLCRLSPPDTLNLIDHLCSINVWYNTQVAIMGNVSHHRASASIHGILMISREQKPHRSASAKTRTLKLPNRNWKSYVTTFPAQVVQADSHH